jgi:FkbM family methyltransferase
VKEIRRFILRVKFFLRNPVKSLRYLLSNEKDYSKISLSSIFKYIEDARLIVEAGAADGVDTMRFSLEYPNSRVVALEPVNQQFTYLKKKFADFKNVEVYNLALSNHSGITQMYLGKSDGHLGGLGSSSLLPPDQHRSYFPQIEFSEIQQVKAVTLEELLLPESQVDLLWLDIQGKELEVLSCSRETFRSKVKVIHLEISRVPLYIGMPKEKEIRKFLEGADFRCVEDRVGAISGNALYINTRFFPEGS